MMTRQTIAVLVALVLSPLLAQAKSDETIVKCESHNHQYRECALPDHGYVRLKRDRNDGRCVKGRTWDYDRRAIWVDDNCQGEFAVETRHHSSGHSDHTAEKAVAATAAIALIAAAASANSKHDKHNNHDSYDDYDDDGYGRAGHSSHTPRWMVGSFTGYNKRYGNARVRLRIDEDGRVKAKVNDTELRGYVNDERLYLGDAEFEIDRGDDGFYTTEVGNWQNRVSYSRD